MTSCVILTTSAQALGRFVPRTGYQLTFPSNLRPWSSPFAKEQFSTTINENSSKSTALSARLQKRRGSSPSRVLEEALSLTGQDEILPPVLSGKVDISYMNVRRYDQQRFSDELLRQRYKIGRRANEPRRSLQTVLAHYIKLNLSRPSRHKPQSFIAGESRKSETTPVSEDEAVLLNSKGYDEQDVRTWSRILTTRDGEIAAERLVAHVDTEAHADKPLPSFVPLFLLRRQHLSPAALRYLVYYYWQVVYRKRSKQHFMAGVSSDWTTTYAKYTKYPVINDSNLFIAIVRLLRHARQTWPEALITVAALFTETFQLFSGNDLPPSSSPYGAKSLSRLTFLYNRMLSLLALPSNINPFHNVVLHQSAQFDILSKMASHQPQLTVSREGYNAIIKMQLADKKSERERDWALLKAESWPPWKQDRTGLDTEKGTEYGRPRAMEAIRRASEAGYGKRTWQKVVEILAGWDLDGSPTIQTRAFLAHREVSKRPLRIRHVKGEGNLDLHPDEMNQSVWVARIRATRSVEEAWACFLMHKDRNFPPHQDVYLPILEKLLSEKRRVARHRDGRTTNYSEPRKPHSMPSTPGDGKEVSAPPQNSRDAVWLRAQPQSFYDLVVQMIDRGIVPTGRCLTLLLSDRETYEIGLKYVNKEFLETNPHGLHKLLDHSADLDKEIIGKMSDKIFAQYIQMLCRSGSPASLWNNGQRSEERSPEGRFWRDQCRLAHSLLLRRKPTYRPAWAPVLFFQALVSRLAPASDKHERFSQIIEAIEPFRDTLDNMRSAGLNIDNEIFQLICRTWEWAGLAAYRSLQRSTVGPETEQAHSKFSEEGLDRARDFLESSPSVLKRHFHSLTSEEIHSGLPTQSMGIPNLLATPGPASLHAFVRSLGTFRDWKGLQDFIEWVDRHQDDIVRAANMRQNGKTILRRTYVSLRVFLERSWLDDPPRSKTGESRLEDDGDLTESLHCEALQQFTAAPESVRLKIRELAEGVQCFGQWPSDDELEEYCKKGTFPVR